MNEQDTFSDVASNIATTTNAAYSFPPQWEPLLYIAATLVAGIAIYKFKKLSRLRFFSLLALSACLASYSYCNNSEFTALLSISFLALFVLATMNILSSLKTGKQHEQ